jgi:hypothetical protein
MGYAEARKGRMKSNRFSEFYLCSHELS